jgi:lysozyme family protein
MGSESFIKAFKITSEFEGISSNDVDDPGGQTYRGISRVFFPNWLGWKLIDAGNPSFNELDQLVKNFYLNEFWNRCNCSNMHEIIAIELFDSAVNCGVTQACKWLQESLNFLNNNQKDYKDIMVDGNVGKNTLWTINQCMYRNGPDYHTLIVKIMNILQGTLYLNIMRKYPVKEKYTGWFKRVSL